MNFDFNPPRTSLLKPSRTTLRIVLPLLLLAGIGGLLWLTPHTLASKPLQASKTMQDVKPVQATNTLQVVNETVAVPMEPEVQREVVQGVVQPGDTITALFKHVFTPQQIHNLSQKCKKVFPLSQLRAGQNYQLTLAGGAFEKLEYDIDQDDQLIVSQGEEGFEVSRTPIPYTVREEVVSGTIETNLFDAVVSSGESETLAINLGDIFAWDIDFIRDIRPGDSFKALVEKRFRKGDAAGYGEILAASFTNQGETVQAYLYKDGDRRAVYYDENGKSLRKAFLRAPLAFRRISSGFSLRRFHPITKTWKAHPAIDYVAPTGTPIMAIGNGTITRIGRNKNNGKFIKLSHNNGMQSLYLHMSRFGKNMKSGKRVSQGQTIGYVGSTGLATGPHLCFRMYKGRRPINPARLKTASAAPVSKANMATFKDSITPLIARLKSESPAAISLTAAGIPTQTETARN
jgi:murein DD-endopeptidase MepM/ murein hydrolase activator NlpD